VVLTPDANPIFYFLTISGGESLMEKCETISKQEVLKTIPSHRLKFYPVVISIKDSVIVYCEEGNDYFEMKVKVVYKPKKILLEFVSFREYLKTLKNGIIETYALKIYLDLRNKLGTEDLVVIVEGQTKRHGLARVVIGDTQLLKKVRDCDIKGM
jgi:hypothetical protein